MGQVAKLPAMCLFPSVKNIDKNPELHLLGCKGKPSCKLTEMTVLS